MPLDVRINHIMKGGNMNITIKKRHATTFVLLSLAIVLFFGFRPTQASAIEQNEKTEGEYVFEYKLGENWKVLDSVEFSKIPADVRFKLPSEAIVLGDVTLRVSKKGGGLGFTDYLSIDGRKAETGDAYANKKLFASDLDVLEVKEELPLIASFSDVEDGDINFTGRIEPEVIEGAPFLLGGQWVKGKAMPEEDYIINTNFGTVPMDDEIQNYPIDKTFAQYHTMPISGHPNGKAYIWVYNDDENIYFVADWTSDNTFDYGLDFFRVHIKDSDYVKSYTQYTKPGNYGKYIYGYTDKAAYEHMYYKIAIPLEEVKGNELKLGFELYGTASTHHTFSIDDITISGVVGKALVEQKTILRQNGMTEYWGNNLNGMDITYMFTNMPQGINATAYAVWQGTQGVEVTFSGTPKEASSAMINLLMDHSVFFSTPGTVAVNPNANAKFNITPAISVTPTITPAIPVKPKMYTIKYNTAGGKAVKAKTVNVNSKIGKLPKTTRKNRSFKGWYTKKAGGKKISTSYIVTKNQTIYAQWNRIATVKKSKTELLKNAKKSSKTIAKLKKNRKVIIIGSKGKYYKVKCSNKTGYIVKKQVKLLK